MSNVPEAPFRAMAEQTLVDPRRIVPVPANLDDVAAAALANPGMSCWAALVERARFEPGESVLINGPTGSSGTVRRPGRQVPWRQEDHRHKPKRQGTRRVAGSGS